MVLCCTTCTEEGTSHSYETTRFSQTVYTAKTRSDILLLCTGSRPFAIDFAVTSPLQPKFISGAAKETGYAAERYSEEVKEMKYEADFEELDIEFKPIVLETFGAVCRRGLDLICLLLVMLQIVATFLLARLFNVLMLNCLVR